MQRPFATILVGPSALFREGLTRILRAARFRIVDSVFHLDDLVPRPLPQQQSFLLIIDSGDDPEATVTQIELFKEQHAAGRVAVLADRHRPSEMVPAFRAGANAYLVKVAPCSSLIKSLELVMLGETILPSAILPLIADYDDNHEDEAGGDVGESAGGLSGVECNYTPRLSYRERCILRSLIEGDSNKAIARKNNIAEATVKVHVKAILRKIRVQNRTQAAIWAINNDASIREIDKSASALVKVLPRPLFGPATVPVLSEIQNAGSELPNAEPMEGACHVALPSIYRFIRKGIDRKHD